jgi:hypothetical protein
MTEMQAAGPEDGSNDYRVHVHEDGPGWEVRIVDPAGSVVWSRSCTQEAEARTLGSTIHQHVYWLSAVKFREYYRLTEAG